MKVSVTLRARIFGVNARPGPETKAKSDGYHCNIPD